MQLTLGFSPCPNDTFIFDALVNKKIDTGDLSFEVLMEDVQTLNEWAIEGRLDCTKISYGVLPVVMDNYRLLESGGALGTGVGPLLIARRPIDPKMIPSLKIAIPGKNTTAHLLFSMAVPDAHNKQFMVFHEIEQAVLDGTVDAGVIIHENRFTYAQKGLFKLVDLGEYWEQQLNCPVPLGGIVTKKNIPDNIVHLIESLITESIRYSWKNYPGLSAFVSENSQEMSESVMRQHINLYVNDYSIALGETGHRAIDQLLITFKRINQ
jgi:1,4-dihydroxy-6-naphthoate synthase